MKSKIKLQTKRFPKSRYIDNYKRLKFLPNFILFFILFLCALSVYWYYSLPSRPIDIKSPSELFSEGNNEPGKPRDLQFTEFSTNDQLLSVSQGSQNCLIEFELDSLEKGWVDSPFWWKPSSECSLDFVGIQVAQLQPQSWQDLINQYGANKVTLINDDWVALLVTAEDGLILGFDPIELLQPVSNDGFSIAAASDTKEIGNTIFYLSEGCINQNNAACELWSLPVFGGELMKIEDNVVLENKDLLLKPLDQVRFARTQDLDEGVNLIVVSRDTSSITLIRYNINSREIIGTIELESSSQGYVDYVR